MTLKIAYLSLGVAALVSAAGCTGAVSHGVTPAGSFSQGTAPAGAAAGGAGGAGVTGSSGGECLLPSESAPGSQAGEPAINPVANFDTAWAIIQRTHWDTTYNGTDWEAVKLELRPKAEAAKTMGELRLVLTDMVSRLRQSHFSIIARELNAVGAEAPDAGSQAADDRSGGTGISVRYLGNQLVVTRVAPLGPAEKAGVRAGYVLSAVGGCPLAPRLAHLPRDRDPRAIALDAYAMGTKALAGPPGGSVRATFLDARNRPLEVTMVREPEPGTLVKFGNLPARMANLEWERHSLKGRTIGVIRFNIWMPVLVAQFDIAMDSLRSSDAIVIDVRGNPGGIGGMSMGIAGHFLDSMRVIGVMKQRGVNDLRFVANPRRVNSSNQRVNPYAGPVALVVDEISVSTTEIFAAGLQQMGRVRVFGSQTAGQALPSVAQQLPNGDVLYHAIANFVSPAGKAIEGPGVIPDVRVKLTRKALLSGKDPALDAALKWAASNPAPWK